MIQKQTIGREGEEQAAKYLEGRGYRIIERNYRQKWGEIDIIAKAPDKTLVFVEVKAISQSGDPAPESRLGGTRYGASITPEENLKKDKLKKLQRTASLYAGSHPALVDDRRGWRIDLLAIDLTNMSSNDDVRHYENI